LYVQNVQTHIMINVWVKLECLIAPVKFVKNNSHPNFTICKIKALF
jgi:hypothetical protein